VVDGLQWRRLVDLAVRPGSGCPARVQEGQEVDPALATSLVTLQYAATSGKPGSTESAQVLRCVNGGRYMRENGPPDAAACASSMLISWELTS
jgi:hypothetical protein